MKTTPAERGITLSGKLPQAVREGTKTMTRRLMAHQPPSEDYRLHIIYCSTDKKEEGKHRWTKADIANFRVLDGTQPTFRCPFVVGDHLYVREEHYRWGVWQPVMNAYTKRRQRKWKFVATKPDVLFADNPPASFSKSRHNVNTERGRWYKRLARFMPKACARTWLEISAVRAERLQEISEEDAKAEGVETIPQFSSGAFVRTAWRDYSNGQNTRCGWNGTHSPRISFTTLWESIHGRGSWDANRWVWVVTFKRIDGKEAA